MEAKLMISRLDEEYASKVKLSSATYWRAARDAEESFSKY
jgi:hypothetical protein